MLLEQEGRNGISKAERVWAQIPSHVRQAIVSQYQETDRNGMRRATTYRKVTAQLRSHIRSEVRRLLERHDYGLIDTLLGI